MKSADDQAILDMRAEIFRLVRLCAPDLASLGVITFEGQAENKSQRRQWRDAVFLPVLVPAVGEAWAAAKRGFREMAAADAALNAKLAGPLARNSRAAGRLIAASLHAPAGEHGLDKFLRAIGSGGSPGNMATVFAARASIFHFPKDIILAGLVFAEMRSAGVENLWGVIDDCLDSIPAGEPSIFRAA